MLIQVISQMLTGTCLASVIFLILSLALFFRFLPQILEWSRALLRGLLILSFRLYQLILSVFKETLGVNLLVGWPRIISCLILSFLCGYGLMKLFDLEHYQLWVLGLAGLHGLVVGLAWDELTSPEGVNLGPRLE